MRHTFVRGVAALVLTTSALAGCDGKSLFVNPKTPLNTGLFMSYVALGNSISAGYQSGGILDSTQRESFAYLLAHQAGTTYNYPSLAAPGCPPPIVNFQTGARLDGGTSTTCAARQAPFNSTLNNVAVPGATTNDLTAVTSPTSNALTTLILGGMTQVQKAIQANPTFVTIEIANNDWLPAGLTGTLEPNAELGSPGLTPTDSVIVQYARAVNQLVAARPNLAGVLFGVFPLNAPGALFPAESLYTNPTLQAEFTAAAGGSVIYYPDCIGTGALISIDILTFWASDAWKQTEAPNIVSCVRGVPEEPYGDFFILDAYKQDTINTAIATWDAYIHAKADSLGWGYLDPEPLFAELKGSGAIPPFPNFASATQPFGQYITLDGIHPSALAHQVLAGALIDEINAVYNTAIPALSAQSARGRVAIR
jgi:lysophospholipase L1-like esterase